MTVQVEPLRGIPLIQAGTDLVSVFLDALKISKFGLENNDIVVVAQKIVSKAENRRVALESVAPSIRAQKLALEVDKDPRLVELILRESVSVIRTKPGVLITRHRLGFVAANAGIDQSNIDHTDGEYALLLPEDPDQSARHLQKKLHSTTNKKIGVIISDSVNRPWRLGSIGIAIGVAHVAMLDDRRGQRDLYDRKLRITVAAWADSIATTALLVMGETNEGVPVAVVRGLPALQNSHLGAHTGNRPLAEDLFQ